MNAAIAQRHPDDRVVLCTVCSCCEALLPTPSPVPGTTLLDLRCPRCGSSDVYHVKTLRHYQAPEVRR